MSALRPRIDFTVVVAGATHTGHTTVRDMLEAQRQFPELDKDHQMVVATKVIYLAARRIGATEAATFDEFVDQLDDIEFEDPPPLAKG